MMLKLHRPDRSVREINALPELGGPECAGYLQRKGRELSAETIVFLLREFAALHRSKLFEACGTLLVGEPDGQGGYVGGHCEGIIVKRAMPFGFLHDSDVRTEYRARCHTRMWECISEGRTAKPFWEERFGYALAELCIEVGRGLKAELERHAIVDSADDEQDPYEIAGADGEDAWIAAMNVHHLKQAIRALPAPVMKAAWMRWVDDLPITAPSGVSITAVLGVSDSMVRRRLRQAEAALSLNPKVTALREDFV